MSEIWGPVECSGIMGLDPGLTGMTKIEADKVAYTAGNTVRYRSPRVPHPRFDWTETATHLVLRCVPYTSGSKIGEGLFYSLAIAVVTN